MVCLVLMPKIKLPPISYSDAILKIDWNDHISLEENRNRIIQIEEAASVSSSQVSSMVGVQQFVLNHSGDQAMNEASVYFKCTDASSLETLKRSLTETISSRWPDAVFEFGISGNIFDMVFAEKEPEIVARVREVGGEGLVPGSLTSLLEDIDRAVLQVQVAKIPVKRDVLYISDAESMALYGIGREQIVSALRSSLNGDTVFEIIQGNRSIPVVLGTDMLEMEELFDKAVVEKEEGVEIPLKRLLRQTYEEDFKSIVSGEEGSYYPVELDVKSSEAGSVMSAVRDAVHKYSNLEVSFSGAFFSNSEMIRQMIVVLLVALAMLFLILASQFESLIQPLIILSEIVIDMSFCLAFLWITGTSINIMSLIGLVVVSGIVINDSILKIDTINKLVASGMETEAAIHEAGHRRLKAIIMTSLTTILSVAPFLSRGNMGADLQFPMALVIIIGMSVGTLVSLFYVPAVYSVIYKHKNGR